MRHFRLSRTLNSYTFLCMINQHIHFILVHVPVYFKQAKLNK